MRIGWPYSPVSKRLSVALFVTVSLLLGTLPTGVWAGEPELQALPEYTDDEIVLLRDAKLIIYDPHTLYDSAVSWSVSTGTNWRDVATGDFNGDGDDEIIVISEDHHEPDDIEDPDNDYDRIVRVFDPVQGPLPAFEGYVYRDYRVLPKNRWWRVATGDTDGDGRDEVVLVTYPNTVTDMKDAAVELWIIDFSNPESGSVSTFTETKVDSVYGGFVNGLIVEDLDGDGVPEIVLSTSVGLGTSDRSRTYWYKSSSGSFGRVGNYNCEGRGFDLAAGNLNSDSIREVVLAASPRDDEHDNKKYKSLKIWNSIYGTPEPLSTTNYWVYNWPGWGWGYYYGLASIVKDEDNYDVPGYYSYSPPYWGFVATGDLNGSGDQEIVTIRNTTRLGGDVNHLRIQDPYQPSGYADLNKTYETLKFQGVATGDFQGVGRDYVALLNPNLPGVSIYDLGNRPRGGLGVDDDGKVAVNSSYKVTYFGGDRPKVMAVGDFDGSRMQTSQSNVGFMVLSEDGSAPFGLQQTISVGCNVPGVTPTYSVTVSSPVDWLTITGGSGTMPGTIGITASLDPFGPGPDYTDDEGTYRTTLTITGSGTGLPALRGNPKEVGVALTILPEMFQTMLPIVDKNN